AKGDHGSAQTARNGRTRGAAFVHCRLVRFKLKEWLKTALGVALLPRFGGVCDRCGCHAGKPACRPSRLPYIAGMSGSVSKPDSCVVAEVMPSPNHGERRDGRRPDMIILHYTGMPDGNSALERLRDPASKVSSHYF